MLLFRRPSGLFSCPLEAVALVLSPLVASVFRRKNVARLLCGSAVADSFSVRTWKFLQLMASLFHLSNVVPTVGVRLRRTLLCRAKRPPFLP